MNLNYIYVPDIGISYTLGLYTDRLYRRRDALVTHHGILITGEPITRVLTLGDKIGP